MFGARKKKLILVVEDERQLAEGLEARLSLEGFDVVLAPDGKEGVDVARTRKPDLIIMDVMMPRLGGMEACRFIRADAGTRDIPILMLTALQTLGDTEDALSAGANSYLSKPYSSDRLLEKIKILLERRSPPSNLPQP